MSLSVKTMDPAAFDEWSVANRADYIESRMRSGESLETATENANRSFDRFFPDGVPTAEQVVFDVVRRVDANEPGDGEGGADGVVGGGTSADEVVGVLWIGVSDAANAGWYVYDIEIHEAERGKGYGRETMLLAETEARARGAKSLGLNVFGFNTVARHLYESLGYEATSIQMKKPLD